MSTTKSERLTWRQAVECAFFSPGTRLALEHVYAEIELWHPELPASNRSWKATVRRVLLRHPRMKRVGRDLWEFLLPDAHC